jgi:hypothetical protein
VVAAATVVSDNPADGDGSLASPDSTVSRATCCCPVCHAVMDGKGCALHPSPSAIARQIATAAVNLLQLIQRRDWLRPALAVYCSVPGFKKWDWIEMLEGRGGGHRTQSSLTLVTVSGPDRRLTATFVVATSVVTGTGLQCWRNVTDRETAKWVNRHRDLRCCSLETRLVSLYIAVEGSKSNRQTPSCFFIFLLDHMTCFRRHLGLVIYLSASK